MDGEQFYRPEANKRGTDPIGERFLRILKKTLHFTLLLLGVHALFFAGYQTYAYLMKDSWFRVRAVEVRGCRTISEQTVVSLARLEGNANLFRLRLKEMAQRIEAHPWVEGVRVKKIFPDRLSIDIEERRPVAILQLEEPYYIDAKGVIFSRASDRDQYDYPFLTGLNRQDLEKEPDRSKFLIAKALDCLMAVDRVKALPFGKISEVRMEKDLGISCVTAVEGVEVRVGWDHYEEKLRRGALIWEDLKQRGIGARAIDCRDLRRMVAKKVTQPSR
ncbi:MAG: FtsQ-type POTRA domain-containing protein [Desulfobacterota bacterium]|nr:FtsQ-type POTRA domain-containing protein [Thermodesulfobacteriota bacterium]